MTNRLKNLATASLAYARTEIVMLSGMAVIAGAAFAFVKLAGEMSEGETRAFDMAVLQALHPGPDSRDPIGPVWLHYAAGDLTSIGSVSILLVLTTAVAGFLLLNRKRLEAGIMVVALGGGLALSQLLKGVFERARPPDAYRAVEALNYSFPSGHAMLSAVVYLTLGAMIARIAPGKRSRIYVMSTAIALTLLVGATRVYLGVHWASDVLGGWCVGAAWATACWLFERWARARLAQA
jgi:undecaprenyl-diphosphatase